MPDDPRAQFVPGALWADWVVRLRPPTSDATKFAKAGAALLLLPGARGPLHGVFAPWTSDPRGLVKTSRHILHTLVSTAGGTAGLRALTQLSDGLLVHGCPINYHRRRESAADATLLDRLSWDRICAAIGTPTGGAPKLRYAELWIWEVLTGGLLEDAPERLRLVDFHAINGYHRFALCLPSAARHLGNHARRVLDEMGCANEPTTWSPPQEWVDLDGLPGNDPDSLGPDKVEPLLRQALPPASVARRLGTSIDHVRLIIRQCPPLVERPRSGKRRSPVRVPFPAELTPDRLHDLVVAQGRSLYAIRADYGVTKGALLSALERDGIPVPLPGRPAELIDEAWLRHEYLDRRRTMPEIAAELGVSPTNVARATSRYGIHRRPRGGASHRSSRPPEPDWPEPLATATCGQGGVQRVGRFQVLARMPSINQAALLLSVGPASLYCQLGQLERACGGPLVSRSTRRHEPQSVTELGRRLLKQADTHLGPHPNAPPAVVPEPLAAAISRFRGTEGLARFEVAARSRTIAKAAIALGTEPHTLDRSLRLIEASCGGPLLERTGVLARHRLTPLGRKLLRQAARFSPGPS